MKLKALDDKTEMEKRILTNHRIHAYRVGATGPRHRFPRDRKIRQHLLLFGGEGESQGRLNIQVMGLRLSGADESKNKGGREEEKETE